jgi:predicted enzyme related to lactoylglutathione lyase
MHKSQLAGFIIDCKTDDLDAAADFWAGALGLKRDAADTPAHTSYVHFEKKDPNGLHIEVQDVMEAPTGQRFCVVRAKRADFAKEANVWK